VLNALNLTSIEPAWSWNIVVYSWLLLHNNAWVIMDPATGILVGRIIAVIIKSNTLWVGLAELSTSGNSVDIMMGSGSLSIMLNAGTELRVTS
jgi:hypothetical protein